MTHGSEAKVGLVVVGLLVLFITGWMLYSGTSYGARTYEVFFFFYDIGQLKEDDEIRLAGLPIGKVTTLEDVPTPPFMGQYRGQRPIRCIRVTGEISRSVDLFDTYNVVIKSGLLGAQAYIHIEPTEEEGRPVRPGDHMVGRAPTLPADVMDEAQGLVRGLRQFTDDPDLRRNVVETSQNISLATAQIAKTAALVTVMLAKHQGAIDRSMANLASFAVRLDTSAAALQGLATDPALHQNIRSAVGEVAASAAEIHRSTEQIRLFLEDPTTGRSVESTMVTLQATASNLESITAHLDQWMTDPETGEGIDRTMAALTQATENIAAITGDVRGLSGKPENQQRLEATLASIEDASARAASAITSVDRYLSDPEIEKSVRGSAGNVEEITAQLRATFDDEFRTNLQDTLREIRVSATQVRASTEKINEVVQDSSAQDIQESLRALREATQNLQKISEDIHSLTGDPKVQDDIRATLSNTRALTEKLGGAGGLLNLETSMHQQELFNTGTDDFESNFDAYLRTPGTYYRVGVSDIGGGSGINAQIGHAGPSGFGYHYGVYRGQLGVGADLGVAGMDVLADIYDPNDVKIDLQGAFPLTESLSLVGGARDIGADNNLLFGVDWRF